MKLNDLYNNGIHFILTHFVIFIPRFYTLEYIHMRDHTLYENESNMGILGYTQLILCEYFGSCWHVNGTICTMDQSDSLYIVKCIIIFVILSTCCIKIVSPSMCLKAFIYYMFMFFFLSRTLYATR